MPEHETETRTPRTGGGVFATTHWSVVLAAGAAPNANAEQALARLCEAYRPPILAYALGLGLSREDAEDATQGFFAHFLAQNLATKVERRVAVKFRSFLLRCFKNYLADQRDFAHAGKRGGGRVAVPLDAPLNDSAPAWQPADERTAEHIYERNWASVLLNHVLDRLDREYVDRGRFTVFERLHVFLLDRKNTASYREAGLPLGMSEDAVKKEVSRMRQRFRELFRQEITHTLGSPDEVEEETLHLFSVLSR